MCRFCRALSAALFVRDPDLVEYVDLGNETERFAALASGEVDVVAGERMTLQKEMLLETLFSTIFFNSSSQS